MYIYSLAKQLFTLDDGWNKFLEKFGDSVSEWTKLSVERMLACDTCAMGIHSYFCASQLCIHSRLFSQNRKLKSSSSCGFKATEQWISTQHFRDYSGIGDVYEVGGTPKEWAVSRESYSSCPCRTRFIPSVQPHTYKSGCNTERAETAKKKRSSQSLNSEHRP